ncbi:MAG TPA: hypothetical protein VLG92_05795 [Candidatus Saccharimonadia bacterium]|nr:hypothetical protein [Candidatus Saccharimonadia bacterium]
MPEFNGGITYAPEMAQPIPDIEQPSVLEAGVDVGPEGQQPYGQVTPGLPEMPASHPGIDVKALSASGLIKACPHYAKLAETNLELARTKAAEVVQRVQERETMREKGMGDEAIKKLQWSAMRERHQEKIKVEEKPVFEKATPETKAGPAQRDTAEQRVVVSDAELVLVVPQYEAAERKVAHQPKTLLSTTQIPVKEAVMLPVHELVEVHTGAEQAVARMAQAARLEVERAYVVTTEVAVDPNADRLVPIQGAATIESIHDRMRFGGYLESTVESTSATDYESLSNQLHVGDPIDATESLADEELALLSPVAELSPVNDETAELVSTVVARPKQPEMPEQTTWGHAMEKEPLEFYDDFTEALRSLITPSEETLVTLHETTDVEEPVVLIDTIQELQPPAIAKTMAERLVELDIEAKEIIAPELKEIVEAVQAVDLLITAEAKPEAIETAQAELEELVIALFEQLGIAYKSEDVAYFVTILLHPGFHLLQTEKPVVVDLEHEGTREAKLGFTQSVSDGLSDVEEAVERLLGKLGVFSAHHTPPAYELAA